MHLLTYALIAVLCVTDAIIHPSTFDTLLACIACFCLGVAVMALKP